MTPTESLGISWPSLIKRIKNRGCWRNWVESEPRLAEVGIDDVAHVVNNPARPAAANIALGALVRLAAVDGGDESDAALLVAHLLANGTRALAIALRDLSPDIDDLIAGQLWMQIRTFPWRRRTRAYAKSLLLDTRAGVVAELFPYRSRAGYDRVIVADLRSWSIQEESRSRQLTEQPYSNRVDEHDSELFDVLEWAHLSGVIGGGEIQLLIDLIRAADATEGSVGIRRGLNIAADIAHVAAQRGVNEKTIRRRRDRALAALRQAGTDYRSQVA